VQYTDNLKHISEILRSVLSNKCKKLLTIGKSGLEASIVSKASCANQKLNQLQNLGIFTNIIIFEKHFQHLQTCKILMN